MKEGGSSVDIFSTPDISHLSMKDYDQVYEPAEDSFLLLDAIEKEYDFLRELKPTICLEVGCGSGVISTFISRLFKGDIFCTSTDINSCAAEITKRTADQNKVDVNPIVTDLVSGLLPRLQNKVDLLIFNPPYVVTVSEEVGSHSIEASWAGGTDGREVTDRLLPLIPSLLSDNSVFYLVAIKENKPHEIGMMLAKSGLKMTTVLERRSGPERLSIQKFVWER